MTGVTEFLVVIVKKGGMSEEARFFKRISTKSAFFIDAKPEIPNVRAKETRLARLMLIKDFLFMHPSPGLLNHRNSNRDLL